MVDIKDRKKDFKKSVDQDAGRRRREETTMAIRKQKKEGQLAKRRHAPTAPPPTDGSVTTTGKYPQASDITRLVQVLASGAPAAELHAATQGIRQLLSRDHNPPVKQVITAGGLPLLVELLMRIDSPQLIMEAAWALTNIASTNYTEAVVAVPNSIPYLVKILTHHDAGIREQAAWCLGNIAGDGAKLRDLVTGAGAANALIQNIKAPANSSLLGNVVWTISNLCRNKPTLGSVNAFIPVLYQVLCTTDNKDEIQADVLWAFSYITEGTNEHIEAVNGLCGQHLATTLVKTISDDSKVFLHAPALRILGNFATGTEAQTQVVIDAGIIGVAPKLLHSTKKNTRKEICWLLSNLAAGSQTQIETITQTPGLLEEIVDIAEISDFLIRKEALWVLCNVASGGTSVQIDFAVQSGIIPALSSALLIAAEGTLTSSVLSAMSDILSVGEKNQDCYTNLFHECEAVDRLEDLQQTEDDAVYQQVLDILERFFGGEAEDDENLAPVVDGDVFGFGMASPAPAKDLFGATGDFQGSSASSVFESTTNFNF